LGFADIILLPSSVDINVGRGGGCGGKEEGRRWKEGKGGGMVV